MGADIPIVSRSCSRIEGSAVVGCVVIEVEAVVAVEAVDIADAVIPATVR